MFTTIIKFVNNKKYLKASRIFDKLTFEEKNNLFMINKNIIYLLENNKKVIENIVNKNNNSIIGLDIEKISFDINRIKNNLPPIIQPN